MRKLVVGAFVTLDGLLTGPRLLRRALTVIASNRHLI
jgi:hypothetical protein